MFNDNRVTLTLLLYNQEKYARQAVESALSQTYEPLVIVISDDCSPDSTFEVVQKTVAEYKGPHEVIVRRNDENLGIVAHVNLVFSDYVDTKYVVYQEGDDIAHPERTSKTVEYMRRSGVSALFCAGRVIDENDVENGMFKKKFDREIVFFDDFLNGHFWFCGALATYDMDIFKHFGPLDEDVYNEDFDLAVRATLLGGIGYSDETLVKYRIHDNNLSFWIKLKNARSFAHAKQIRGESLQHRIANHKRLFSYLEKDEHKAHVRERLAIFEYEMKVRNGVGIGERFKFLRSKLYSGYGLRKKLKYALMTFNYNLFFFLFLYLRKPNSGYET